MRLVRKKPKKPTELQVKRYEKLLIRYEQEAGSELLILRPFDRLLKTGGASYRDMQRAIKIVENLIKMEQKMKTMSG